MDRLHRRLRQIAFYEEPIDLDGGEQMTPSQNSGGFDQGENLVSNTPFKHRKFKRPATGRGPPGTLNLEAMMLSNERDLNNRNKNKPIGRTNLTPG
jgi:hypothetical protein